MREELAENLSPMNLNNNSTMTKFIDIPLYVHICKMTFDLWIINSYPELDVCHKVSLISLNYVLSYDGIDSYSRAKYFHSKLQSIPTIPIRLY